MTAKGKPGATGGKTGDRAGRQSNRFSFGFSVFHFPFSILDFGFSFSSRVKSAVNQRMTAHHQIISAQPIPTSPAMWQSCYASPCGNLTSLDHSSLIAHCSSPAAHRPPLPNATASSHAERKGPSGVSRGCLRLVVCRHMIMDDSATLRLYPIPIILVTVPWIPELPNRRRGG